MYRFFRYFSATTPFYRKLCWFFNKIPQKYVQNFGPKVVQRKIGDGGIFLSGNPLGRRLFGEVSKPFCFKLEPFANRIPPLVMIEKSRKTTEWNSLGSVG
jgi:hypothetical protein